MKATLVRALAGTTLLAGAIAAATAAAPITRNNPLRVSMYATGNGGIEVVLTNTSNKIARVPKYQLPLGELQAKLFNVNRDGAQVAYEGPMIKRGLPSASDFAILRPGQSYRSVIQLADSYDMRKSGTYTINLASSMQFASMSDGSMLKTTRGAPLTLGSAPLRMYATGKLPNPTKGKGKPGGGTGGTSINGVATVGCSATQITGIGSAINAARSYTENAKGYLAGNNQGPRYTTWFGAYTSSRYNTANQHFASIDSAMDQTGDKVKINCGCNQSYYAYVYPTKPYEIFVCRAFWSASTTGTDSKAGTLVHEMSHFNVVAGTDDVVYGQAGAKNLAITDPNGALNNADSHEYFAENTPSQN
ncbi:M35 family metallo-endopeptidase [Thermomonas sp. HDW16]|uniref:M35 family metallo-endopeptidase n=1 Tax=Thermomonas sp. HDW16 TaxID=2714945 RepID=UPI00140A0545|nr:M35 family metallo-endopeptidase [Thermomonas sp. HDW16]QIL20472.1 protease [Thermomonas sp. HDW16]